MILAGAGETGSRNRPRLTDHFGARPRTPGKKRKPRPGRSGNRLHRKPTEGKADEARGKPSGQARRRRARSEAKPSEADTVALGFSPSALPELVRELVRDLQRIPACFQSFRESWNQPSS